MGPAVITTPRLALRAWESGDAVDVVRLFDAPEVNRYINHGKPVGLEDAHEFIARQIRTQSQRGWCRWAIALHAEPERLAGFCGPGCTFAPDIELGWTLRHDLWGHGYATEAATAALSFLFAVVGFAEVVSAIDPTNTASERVARRLDMTPAGTFDHDGTLLTRWAIANPLPEPPCDPNYVRHCEGEVSGSSLRPDATRS